MSECRIQAGFNCAVHADKEWNAALDAAAKAVEYQLGGHRDAFERGLHGGAVAVILALKR